MGSQFYGSLDPPPFVQKIRSRIFSCKPTNINPRLEVGFKRCWANWRKIRYPNEIGPAPTGADLLKFMWNVGALWGGMPTARGPELNDSIYYGLWYTMLELFREQYPVFFEHYSYEDEINIYNALCQMGLRGFFTFSLPPIH